MSDSDKKLRVALVGCGRISQYHFDAIKNNSDSLELVAVCDVVPEKADAAGHKTGADIYYSFSEMLERKDIDIVSVCTPSGMHPQHGIMAARKGFHVVCEKPMGTNLKMAEELINACDEAGVQLFVVKQNRLNSTLQLVKKAIDKNRFGRIYMATVNVFWQRPQSYYDAARWRGTWEFDGGAFMNQASHYVDMVEWLIGPVESVSAMTATLARKIETEDTGSAILKFRNGAIGNINVTMLTYPKNMEGSLTILGEKGTVRIGGTAVNRIDHWEFSDYDDDDKLVDISGYTPPSVYGFGHTGYYKNVADTLLKRGEAMTDGREGKKSLEIILGIYKAARERREIQLPL
ncbi:MAG: Gfo/Idh/MocA family oxidoreductase [Clostridiales bacterium]|jgi:UDP-N-acetyl-2-amino-2-deoxyglucuronate dehydrogenase|nr:Gfo/Idh/MocA family oxidoreductase [Eubacteriales bacterium]MDH7566161.1 Gfo/Idh/MocA family oxidoreductase [Clostridiales bacterium]